MGKKIPADGIIFFIPAIITLPFGLFRRYFMDNFNNGIVCEVKNCVYHDCETYCTAEKIAVGPSYATTSSDTICATFKQKED